MLGQLRSHLPLETVKYIEKGQNILKIAQVNLVYRIPETLHQKLIELLIEGNP